MVKRPPLPFGQRRAPTVDVIEATHLAWLVELAQELDTSG